MRSVFAGTSPQAVGQGEAWGRISHTTLGVVETFGVEGTPQAFARTTSAVRTSGVDHLKVCVQLKGRAVVQQDGREIVVQPGELAVYETGRPYLLVLDAPFSCAVMTVPRHALGLGGSAIARALQRPYAASMGPGAVLTGFLTNPATQASDLRASAGSRVGDAAIALLAATLMDTLGTTVAGTDDAMRRDVLSYVRCHLADRDLSHSSVAAAHHMSPRTLHRLFEGEPTTVADHIRHQRLEEARRRLADPGHAHLPIAAVGAACGYPDAGYFSRLFKATYGICPSSVRSSMVVPDPVMPERRAGDLTYD